MCFSATASFVTAAVATAAGSAALIRAGRREEFPLAATPLVFAFQQTIEGLLWSTLPSAPDGPAAARLVVLFLLLAKVFWPVFAPLALLLVEPDPVQRRWLTGALALGVLSAMYFAWSILAHSVAATAASGHIAYVGEPPVPLVIGIAYFLATGVAPVLSSHRVLRGFGAVVLAGYATSWLFYWEAFSSVWCFFAAAASAIIVFHFERVRRLRAAATTA